MKGKVEFIGDDDLINPVDHKHYRLVGIEGVVPQRIVSTDIIGDAQPGDIAVLDDSGHVTSFEKGDSE